MYKHLFGPVLSRRLGVSLGVDLVAHKICSLDCVYCECGKTTKLTLERKEYVPYNDVIKELEHYLSNNPLPDYITFSGSGEPTLNTRIGDVIEYIKNFQVTSSSLNSNNNSNNDKKNISIAVLTNSTLLGDKAVRNSLLKADLVMPSLDAASLSAFQNINRPHKKIDLEKYIQGIIDFRKVYKGKLALEILILPSFNNSESDLKLLKEACYKINPDVIQLNTLDRPGVISNLIPAAKEELESIKAYFESKTKEESESNLNSKMIPIEIIASTLKAEDGNKDNNKNKKKIYRSDIKSAIVETIYRRPCTIEDLSSIIGSDKNEIEKYLKELEVSGDVESVKEDRGIFYSIVKK